jgi:hypothetical protein
MQWGRKANEAPDRHTNRNTTYNRADSLVVDETLGEMK